MIDNAKTMIVVDAFPKVLTHIKSNLLRAHEREVRIELQCYDEQTNEFPFSTVTAHHGVKVQAYWASEQLNLIVDGEQTLLALFNNQLSDVFHALWSNDLYLSCMSHMGFMREHCFHQLMRAIDDNVGAEQLKAIILSQKGFHESKVPGQLELFER